MEITNALQYQHLLAVTPEKLCLLWLYQHQLHANP